MNGNSREAVFQEIISLADAMADRPNGKTP